MQRVDYIQNLVEPLLMEKTLHAVIYFSPHHKHTCLALFSHELHSALFLPAGKDEAVVSHLLIKSLESFLSETLFDRHFCDLVIFILYVWVFVCMHACALRACLVSEKSRREHQIPWVVARSHVSAWEENPSPLHEQHMFLTIQPCLQPQHFDVKNKVFHSQTLSSQDKVKVYNSAPFH